MRNTRFACVAAGPLKRDGADVRGVHRAVERVGDAGRARGIAGRAVELPGRVRDRRIDVGKDERNLARTLAGDRHAPRAAGRERRAQKKQAPVLHSPPAPSGYSRSPLRCGPGGEIPRDPSCGGRGGALRLDVREQAGGARRVRAGRVAGRELIGALARVGDAVHLHQRLHGQELAFGGELAARELAAVGLQRGERARRRRRQVAAPRVDERDLARQHVVRRRGLGRRGGRRDARLGRVTPDRPGGGRRRGTRRLGRGQRFQPLAGARARSRVASSGIDSGGGGQAPDVARVQRPDERAAAHDRERHHGGHAQAQPRHGGTRAVGARSPRPPRPAAAGRATRAAAAAGRRAATSRCRACARSDRRASVSDLSSVVGSLS